MLEFPTSGTGHPVPGVSRMIDQGPRSFGNVDTAMPLTYTGPYGVLLDDDVKRQVVSIATDGANNLIALKPLG